MYLSIDKIVVLMSSTGIINKMFGIDNSLALWVISLHPMVFLVGNGGDYNILLSLYFHCVLCC